jgi:hypothetical protein
MKVFKPPATLGYPTYSSVREVAYRHGELVPLSRQGVKEQIYFIGSAILFFYFFSSISAPLPDLFRFRINAEIINILDI